jgi:hypothetical protein
MKKVLLENCSLGQCSVRQLIVGTVMISRIMGDQMTAIAVDKINLFMAIIVTSFILARRWSGGL